MATGTADAARPPRLDHTANLLGALAVAVTDRCVDEAGRAAGHGQSEAAALSALDQFLAGASIDRLADVVGLSQSGAVRLVDRLERAGLVRRGRGDDGRVTAISLTSEGRRAAYGIERARLRRLEEVLAPLAPADRETLDALTGRLLVGMMREPGATRWTCRLCDLSACERPTGGCPVERAAQARYGASPTSTGEPSHP